MTTTPAAPVKYDFTTTSFRQNPWDLYARMREDDPAYWHPLLNGWCFTRYDDVRTMSRNRTLSVDRLDELVPGLSPHLADKWARVRTFFANWFFFADPPRHTALRGLVAQAFTPRSIQALEPVIEAKVEEYLDRIVAAGPTADLVTDIAFRIPSDVICHMLGIPAADQDKFKKWADAIFAVPGFIMERDLAVETSYEAVLSLEAFLRDLIAVRRTDPRDDILSALVHAEEDGRRLSEQELVSTCAMLLVGGHDTTAHQIALTVLALVRNPDQLRLLVERPELIDSAIEETLRYESPTVHNMRVATEDFMVGDCQVRAGESVFGLIAAANRDPRIFADPEHLDITRSVNPRHLAFSLGPHVCIGAPLARVETRIALPAILRRLPDLELDVDDSEIQYLDTFVMRGVERLPVRFRR